MAADRGHLAARAAARLGGDPGGRRVGHGAGTPLDVAQRVDELAPGRGQPRPAVEALEQAFGLARPAEAAHPVEHGAEDVAHALGPRGAAQPRRDTHEQGGADGAPQESAKPSDPIRPAPSVVAASSAARASPTRTVCGSGRTSRQASASHAATPARTIGAVLASSTANATTAASASGRASTAATWALTAAAAGASPPACGPARSARR